jgi:hypothetical protein
MENNGRKLQSTPNIPVHFVVISSSSGDGTVSNSTINAQISVLNAALAPTFSFFLSSVQRVTNDSAYNCSSTDDNFMIPYHLGDAETLNFYTCNLLDSAGFANYPSDGAGTSTDGVVVAFDSLPGGSFSGYNDEM